MTGARAAARDQLDRVLEGIRSWLLIALGSDTGSVPAAHAQAALAELADSDLAHDAALSLMEICHPTLDAEYPPVVPPEWWASPLGLAISRALARDDALSLLRLMGPQAQGLEETVSLARDRGASWAQIAEALGITRQAAWERFRSRWWI